MEDNLTPMAREQRIREGLKELLELLQKFQREKSEVLKPDHPFLRLVATFISFLIMALKNDLSLPRRARGAVSNALDELGALAAGELTTDDACARLEKARRVLAEWVV